MKLWQRNVFAFGSLIEMSDARTRVGEIINYLVWRIYCKCNGQAVACLLHFVASKIDFVFLGFNLFRVVRPPYAVCKCNRWIALCVQTRLPHQLWRRGDSHCHRLTAIVIGITTNVCLLSRCDVVCSTISIEFGIAQRTHIVPSMEKKKKKKLCTRNEPLLQFNWLTHIHDCALCAAFHSVFHHSLHSIFNSIVLSIKNKAINLIALERYRDARSVHRTDANSFLPFEGTLFSNQLLFSLSFCLSPAQFAHISSDQASATQFQFESHTHNSKFHLTYSQSFMRAFARSIWLTSFILCGK